MNRLQLPECTNGDAEQAFDVIWAVLNDYQDKVIPSDEANRRFLDPKDADANEEQWDDICTAMAWIREATNLPAETEPAPTPGLLAEFTTGDFPVTWELLQGEHVITYGLQVTRYRDDIAASREYGECIRHSLECAGKLDIEDKREMLVNAWAEHPSDGHVYRLVRLGPEEVTPWRFSLECCADYTVHHGSRMTVGEPVEVSQSAFNDFEHICTFAKEIAAILECDPVTVMSSIGG